jgi:hypothetical protein
VRYQKIVRGAKIYIVFYAASAARSFIQQHHDKGQNCGKHGGNRKFSVEAVPNEEIKISLRLSKSLQEHEEDAKLEMSTILITGLPTFLGKDHTIANVNDLFKLGIGMSNDNDEGDWEEDKIVHTEYHNQRFGSALLRFSTVGMASYVVSAYNGIIWKEINIYVKCVPDEYIEDYLPGRTGGEKGVKLLAKSLKYGFDIAYTACFTLI